MANSPVRKAWIVVALAGVASGYLACVGRAGAGQRILEGLLAEHKQDLRLLREWLESRMEAGGPGASVSVNTPAAHDATPGIQEDPRLIAVSVWWQDTGGQRVYWGVKYGDHPKASCWLRRHAIEPGASVLNTWRDGVTPQYWEYEECWGSLLRPGTPESTLYGLRMLIRVP